MSHKKTLNNIIIGISASFSISLFILSGILIMSSDQMESIALASNESLVQTSQDFNWTMGFGIFGVLVGATSFALLSFIFAHRHHKI
jgi:hypothetical protein